MFEVRTLLLFSFSLKSFLGILLFVYSFKNITFKPTQYVALGNIISALGFLVHSFYPYPAEVINLILLNLMVIMGDSLFLVGLWVLQNKKVNKVLVYSIVFISLVQTFYFTEIWRHDGIRVAINSIIYAIVGILVLNEFSGLLKKRIPALYYTIGIILITHCAILFLRAILVFRSYRIDLMAPSTISTFMHLYIVLGQTSAVFCYAIIVNQLLREELALSLEKQKKLQVFKEDLTSMIVHDLKNPLNALINSHLIFNGNQLKQFVNQTSQQMLALVLNILDINKYEDSKMPVNQENIKLETILDDCINEIISLCEQKNITITRKINDNIIIYVDSGLVKRIFNNLLTNAIKFSPTNEEITISARIINKYVKIFITDKGEGIAPEYHETIFSKYGQLITKDSGIAQSTGLGLTFCKMAVEAHGCQIGIESETKKGSTFWFTLPLAEGYNYNIEEKEATSIIMDNTLKLTDYEKQTIMSCANALKEADIFELSFIKKQLASIENNSSENIKEWVNLIIQAVYNGNEKSYRQLIHLITG